MRVADVLLLWTPSPSPDIVKQRVLVTVDDVQQSGIEVGPIEGQVQIVVKANSSVKFKVETEDTEGKVIPSTEFTFRIGDLVDPLPATDLGFEIVGVRDVEDPPPAEPT